MIQGQFPHVNAVSDMVNLVLCSYNSPLIFIVHNWEPEIAPISSIRSSIGGYMRNPPASAPIGIHANLNLDMMDQNMFLITAVFSLRICI